MENIVVRYAKNSDYDMVEVLMKQVQQMHVEWRPDIYKMGATVLSKGIYEKAVAEKNFLVAEVEEMVVGLLFFYVYHRENDSSVTRDVLFVDSMAVHEDYRGQGIGHALFDYVKVVAKEKQIAAIELSVNAKNVDAMAMYRKYGFGEKSITMEMVL
ncbi:MAG: GNAT family N-acetyltransferase [Roseburia sp.]|nr:GNAT family N-acetyltransferase [Roseburia sp.]